MAGISRSKYAKIGDYPNIEIANRCRCSVQVISIGVRVSCKFSPSAQPYTELFNHLI